jgi:hypothetical protein
MQIRGYADAAKLSDLQRLTLFAEQFSARNGSLRTSCWYVVNQFLNTDPDLRPLPLENSKEDVARFAKNGGLILDTRELFQLVRAVDAGRLASAEARRMLRSSTGIFKFHFNAHRTSPDVVSTEPSESDVVSVEPDGKGEWPLYPNAYQTGTLYL